MISVLLHVTVHPSVDLDGIHLLRVDVSIALIRLEYHPLILFKHL